MKAKLKTLITNPALLFAAVLTAVFLVGILALDPLVFQRTISVAAPAKKNLPIYCVNRNDNKIAISFDAAWGAGR